MTAERRDRRIVRRDGSLWDLDAEASWLAGMERRQAPRRVERLSDTDPMFQTPSSEQDAAAPSRALLALLRETRDALEHLALHTPFCAWTRRAKDCDCGLVEIRGRLAALDTEPVR